MPLQLCAMSRLTALERVHIYLSMNVCSRRQQRAQHINREAVMHIIPLQALYGGVHIVHVNHLHLNHMCVLIQNLPLLHCVLI